MSLQSFWERLETSPVGDFIASSPWAFPTIESLHVIAIVTVVGTVAVMDLRLMGLASGAWRATQVSRDTLKLTWAGFLLAVISGALLFVSKAHIYAIEPWFRWKLALLALAGLNMILFHKGVWQRVVGWDSDAAPPSAARLAGALSLGLWLAAILCGRFIGFTLGQYE